MNESKRLNIALKILCEDKFNCGSYFRPESESHNYYERLEKSGISAQFHRYILEKFERDGIIDVIKLPQLYSLPAQIQVLPEAKILLDNGGYGEKTKWSFIIPNLIAGGLFVLSCVQFYYSRIDNRNMNLQINTLEQQIQDLEMKLEAIDTTNYCHSCEPKY